MSSFEEKYWKFIQKMAIEREFSSNKNTYRYYISKNKNITWDIILQNPSFEWNDVGISSNINITPEIVYINPDIDWSPFAISGNPNFSWKYIYNTYIKPYDHKKDEWFLKTFGYKRTFIPLDFSTISRSKYITIDIIDDNNYSWYYDELAINPNITYEQILERKDLFKDWKYISRNHTITWDVIQSVPEIKENINLFDYSKNQNITWDVVRDNIKMKDSKDRGWCFDTLCKHPNITFDIIKDNPSYFNNWYNISQNPNITPEIVRENIDLPWDYGDLSFNPSITFEFYEENPEKDWELGGILNNSFDGARYEHKKQIYVKDIAEQCRDWWYSPYNKVSCKQREVVFKTPGLSVYEVYGN